MERHSIISNVDRRIRVWFTVVKRCSSADVVSGRTRGAPMIQSVDRAIRILGVLQGARRLSLSEIAARLGLPPSTTHGILKTLQAHGMVVQDRDSNRYQLGPAVLKLGNVYLDTLELRSRALTWAE